ncbi:polyketide synthase [Phlyctema vagabunda]|uniref:Polyketide synthase n=1 Tax=Phlyctema vagabunda TaxID=108571 RepID=A0ABR4PDF1_9HELO
MGILPGWWLGEDDNRSDEPYVSPQRWEEELRNAGFAGVEAAPLDQTSPYHLNATILARPIQSTQSSKGITLLTSDVVGQITHIVEDMFVKRGLHVDFCTLSQEPTPGQDIVSLLDIEKPFFAGISESDLSDFLCLVSNLESRRVLWVTKASQIYCKDPEYSLAIGMSRTVRSELLAAFATLEIDSLESEAVVCDAIFKVYEKLQQSQEETGLDPDYEFALSDGLVRISRFHWISIPEESSKNSVNSGPKTLEIGTRGLLQTLQWVLRSRSELEADDVEVEVRAMGMNFKDVLIAMGIVDGRDPEKDDLGCECSGIVRRIGLNVQNVEVGDRVVVFSPGCLCTEMTIPSRLCTKIPDSLSFEEAATMPTVYSTVIRAIMELGKLEAGQSILVHSAAGGVGIAAIYLAKMIGADIYVTVGTPEKVEFVANEFGIDRSHIFNSRDDSFLNGLLQATNGRGVDLVLNSLSGELLHASWKCVANYGMMIEIGKRDLIGRGKLSMDIFEANRGYVGLDIAQIIEDRPAIATRLVTRTIELYEEGSIKPIHPITRFDAAAIEDAFRYLQKGLHTGKVVITMPSSVDDLPTAVAARPLTFRPDVSYLLIGGLGGLGQSTAKWMAEHGAKNLVFLSRSAGATETYEAFFNELVAIGCAYQSFRGSVTNLKDVENAVLNAATPIGGVLQMSMVLRDQPISEISIGDWEAVVSPKIQGTWNLHKALSKEKLDFFVLFSSVSGLIGNWGQANYAAANTFLDSFVQYRQSLGLPASVLEIGCMEEVGYVSQNPAVMEVCRSSAMYMLSERDFLESLQLIIERSTPLPAPKTLASTDGYLNTSQVAIGLASTLPLGDPSNRTIWKRDPRMAVYHNLKEQSAATSSSTDSELKTFLASITTDSTKLSTTSSVEFLAREIGIHVCSFLMKSEEELDTSLSLTAIGVDSLIAIEIRNWWRQSLGVEISVLELLNGGSIRQLGELAVLKLRQKLELASGGSKGGSDIREDGDTYLVNKAP